MRTQTIKDYFSWEKLGRLGQKAGVVQVRRKPGSASSGVGENLEGRDGWCWGLARDVSQTLSFHLAQGFPTTLDRAPGAMAAQTMNFFFMCVIYLFNIFD